MSKQQTSVDVLTGNKLIALFMGNEFYYKNIFYKGGMPYNTFPDGHHYATQDQLKYHSSWDWIMPVLEKIRGLGYRIDITIGSLGCDVHITKVVGEHRLNIVAYSSPIDAIYTACVQFILWYNTQTKKQ